jgi:UrcA family protein
MSTRHVQVFIAAAICLAAAIAPRGADAGEASTIASPQDREPFEFIYKFDSLDLQTDGGTRRVYRNLVLRAQRACSEDRSSLLGLYRMDRRCATALVNDVVQRIGSPVLAALHARSPAANGFAAASRDRNFASSL